MSDPRVQVVVRADATLGESPLWDAPTSSLIWTDIAEYAVHVTRTGGSGAVDSVIERVAPVGALVPHVDGGYVLAEGARVLHVSPGFELLDVIAEVSLPADSRFNDGEVDPAGRFVLGVLAPDAAGFLLSIDVSGKVRTLVENVGCTNGLVWSIDGATMYYVDSGTGGVDAFSYDLSTGDVTDRRTAVRVDGGLPDGMTIDDEGCLWVAVWGAGEVHRYHPNGTLLDMLAFPTDNVTCPVFGGPDLRTLYVTSARTGLDATQLNRQPEAGATFACDVGVRGVPRSEFGARASGGVPARR